MPGLKGSENGDMYVKIKVVIPADMTESQKKLFASFAKSYEENPRSSISV